jgi:hypothetical protein
MNEYNDRFIKSALIQSKNFNTLFESVILYENQMIEVINKKKELELVVCCVDFFYFN